MPPVPKSFSGRASGRRASKMFYILPKRHKAEIIGRFASLALLLIIWYFLVS
jgi:hypothetical protein